MNLKAYFDFFLKKFYLIYKIYSLNLPFIYDEINHRKYH